MSISTTEKKRNLVTAKEIAEYYGVTKYTVFGWSRRGVIPTFLRVDKTVRFDFDEVKAALQPDNP